MSKVIKVMKQENIKITPEPMFDAVEFLGRDDGVFAFFGMSEKVGRNRLDILTISKFKPNETKDKSGRLIVSSSLYRGHIVSHKLGDSPIPLFVSKNFPFPLYRTEITLSARHSSAMDSECEYMTYVSPVNFKLKGKESRLCFDVIETKFKDLESLVSGDYYIRNHMMAKQIMLPKM